MTMSNGAGPTGQTVQVVLGSMSRVEEYQKLVTTLKEAGGEVHAEMVDRILDGGESCTKPSSRKTLM